MIHKQDTCLRRPAVLVVAAALLSAAAAPAYSDSGKASRIGRLSEPPTATAVDPGLSVGIPPRDEHGSNRDDAPAGTFVPPHRPRKPETGDRTSREDGDQPANERVDKQSEQGEGDPGPATAKPGMREITDPPRPGSRDFAKQGGGSLLDRPVGGFKRSETAVLPNPAGAQYEPCELLVGTRTMDDARFLERLLRDTSLSVKRRHALPQLGLVLSVFCDHGNHPLEEVIESLSGHDGVLDAGLNHRYQLAAGRDYYAAAMGWQPDLGRCGAERKIGLIDTTVDTAHRAFADARITTMDIVSTGTRRAGPEHGTAVASVLAGSGGGMPGLVDSAQLVSINVFRQREDDIVDTNAELLVRAIDQLLGLDTELINMSIAGPANPLLKRAVGVAAERGILLVAAGGNGEHQPAYPAAYDGVLAVTAVDASNRAYRRASRGDYLDFSAPGVDLFLAAPGNGSKYYTGTSFATPFVTAALAVLMTNHPDAGPGELAARLAEQSRDLGARGRDPVFGWGLIRAPLECRGLAAR